MVTYYMIMPQTAPRWNRILLLLLQNQRPMQHLPPKHKSEECWQLFHSDGFSLVVIKISKMSQNMELCSHKTGTEIVTWANLASEVVELRWAHWAVRHRWRSGCSFPVFHWMSHQHAHGPQVETSTKVTKGAMTETLPSYFCLGLHHAPM
jgi:hypothetical protein